MPDHHKPAGDVVDHLWARIAQPRGVRRDREVPELLAHHEHDEAASPTTDMTCSSASSSGPRPTQAADVLELARLADVVGLDLVTFQDHPYQATLPGHLDAAVGRRGRRRPTSASRPTSPTCRCAHRSCWRAASRASTSSAAAASSSASAPARSGTRSPPTAARALTPGQGVDALSEAIDDHPRDVGGRRPGRSAIDGDALRQVPAPIPARRRYTTSRSGSAPTSRGCSR